MIVNLTQHPATPAQVAAGVVDLRGGFAAKALTFGSLPTSIEIRRRAEVLAALAQSQFCGCEGSDSLAKGCALHGTDGGPCLVMIGGAPYLMAPLERELVDLGMTPVYAFSLRESVESTDSDGNVTKTQVFRHLGFVSNDTEYYVG